MMRRLTWLIVLMALVSFSSNACIGRMAATREVSKANLRISDDKWPREVTFLVLHVIPVYPIAYIADVLVFNSVEFWTGVNPISGEQRLASAGDRRVVRGPAGEMAISTLREDGSIDIELYASDGSAGFVNLSRDADGIAARDVVGNVLGTLGYDGSLRLAAGSQEVAAR